MKICLLIATGSGAQTTFEHGGPVVRIGRDPDCELSIPGDAGAKVSRQHARIDLAAGGATLADLGSSNGTLLNDKRLKEPARLRVGDRIQLGYTGATLTVRELDLAAPPVGKAARVPPVLWIGSGAAVALVVLLIVVFWPRHTKETEAGGHGGSPPPTQPEPSVAPAEEVVALDRGEVHEAFAQPVNYRPQPSPLVTKQPPELPDELPPEQKPEGEDVQWLPGYWAWDDDAKDYVWVSGCWRNAPPGRHWVAGAWHEVEGGWMWSAGFWADDETQEVSYVPAPPPPEEEEQSERAPSPTDVYVPGAWVWQNADWAWRMGYWLTPRADWVWVLPSYIWTPGGYVFVDGYWDRALERRGLLLAPVRVPRRRVKDWTYVGRDWVRPDFLLRALFVGPGRGHYYFGDYFASRYAERDFVPFANYRPTRLSYDPLFEYYRPFFRENPTWDRDFRTYTQKNSALAHLERGRRETVTRVAGLALRASRAPAFELKTHAVKPEDRGAERSQIQRNRQVAEMRRKHEAKALEENARRSAVAPGPRHGPAAPPPAARPLLVPPKPAVARAAPVVHAPPRPPAPRVVQRQPPRYVPPKQPQPPRRR
jgi:pSer/pThr/pTyr-binding forkhead associated (FHA) protein